jgi:hypothetical protein
VFLEHATRRLHIAAVTAHPTRDPTTQQARNLATELGALLSSTRFLIRDRDGKYSPTFDAVFHADEINILKTVPRALRMNAHCERIIQTLRHELCDYVLVLNETHARRLLATYQRHYNSHRPHQARNQLPPDNDQASSDDFSGGAGFSAVGPATPRSSGPMPRPWCSGSTSSHGTNAVRTPSLIAVMKPTVRPVCSSTGQ